MHVKARTLVSVFGLELLTTVTVVKMYLFESPLFIKRIDHPTSMKELIFLPVFFIPFFFFFFCHLHLCRCS